MVRVGAVDQNVGGGDAGGFFDLGDDRIQVFSRDHEDVASDNREFWKRLFLQHHGDSAELAFLSIGFARMDATGDDHRIIGGELCGRRADTQAGRSGVVGIGGVGGASRKCAGDEHQEGCAEPVRPAMTSQRGRK